MEHLLLAVLIIALCGLLAWSMQRGPKPRHLRHRWIGREIDAVIGRGR